MPVDTIHSFGGAGDSPARCLEINTPGGFDTYYADLARTFTQGAAIDMDVLRELQLRNGIAPV